MNKEAISSDWIKGRLKQQELVIPSDDFILVTENVRLFEERRKRGELVVPVIMGPSGSGKDALVDMIDKNRFARVRTFTTRPRGRDESEENDVYIRGTMEDVERMVGEGRFLEGPVNYDGNFYGMIGDVVEEALNQGKIPAFRLELNGVRRLKELKEEGHPLFENINFWVIFVCPPEQCEWMRRLIKRDVMCKDGEEKQKMRQKTKKRWKQALSDLDWMKEADEIILNDKGIDGLKRLVGGIEWRIDWWNS